MRVSMRITGPQILYGFLLLQAGRRSVMLSIAYLTKTHRSDSEKQLISKCYQKTDFGNFCAYLVDLDCIGPQWEKLSFL